MKSLRTNVSAATMQQKSKYTKGTKIFSENFCAFYVLLKSDVGLKLFETLDSNPTTAQLDDAATFEIVEYGGGSLTRGADETRNVLVSERHDVISAGAFEFGRAR